ncbi:helix-turn-helix transcriptional regulator [Kineococcus sp. SYSU DK018]|uniref:helix-turn-helix transcriptional regulator n=1 Tax=Kineococcus sp. SYSU DK018 TaxID=3383139 RepID=UPI003D7F154D
MYEERASAVPGAVRWTHRPAPGDTPGLVLPDGCADLLWSGHELVVAGPDTRAHAGGPGGPWAGVRLPPGLAPAVLGVPAVHLRDRRVPLADVWGAARVRELTERVATAADPAAALDALTASLVRRSPPPEPLVRHAARLLAQGLPVARVAAELGVGERRLHRTSLVAFGYGPKTLARVLRLQRALAASRAGQPAARVAAATGYADQQHLAREVRALTGTTLSRLRG